MRRNLLFLTPIFALAYGLVLVWALAQAWRAPLANWDVLPYTALALRLNGTPDDMLRAQSLESIRDAFPSHYSGFLDGSSYVHTVATEDSAFLAQLPFYSVKPLYVAGVWAVGQMLGNFASASVAVAAFGFLLMGIAAAYLRPASVPWPPWLAALVALLLAPPPLTLLAAASTPDSLATALFLGGVAIFSRNPEFDGPFTMRLAGHTLLLAAVATRPDAVLPATAFAVFAGLISGRRGEFMLLTLAAAGLWLMSGIWGGHYAWQVLIVHTLIGPMPHPETMAEGLSIVGYLGALQHCAAQLSLNPRFVLMVLIGGGGLAVSLRRRGRWGTVLLATGLANIAGHILGFPLADGYQERLFAAGYFLILAGAAPLFLGWGPAETKP